MSTSTEQQVTDLIKAFDKHLEAIENVLLEALLDSWTLEKGKYSALELAVKAAEEIKQLDKDSSELRQRFC